MRPLACLGACALSVAIVAFLAALLVYAKWEASP